MRLTYHMVIIKVAFNSGYYNMMLNRIKFINIKFIDFDSFILYSIKLTHLVNTFKLLNLNNLYNNLCNILLSVPMKQKN